MRGPVLDALRAIGKELDADIYPRVCNGGIVAPSGFDVAIRITGAEKTDERKRQARSPAGSRQGASGRQRQAGGYRKARSAAPLVSERVRQAYLGQLDAITKAYPLTRSWQQREGLWLSIESSILVGLDRRATFLVAFPFFEGAPPKGWGFWSTLISSKWIGPRHTNFPDGSICAYEPRDLTWQSGGSIVSLLDLYTLWALRHLHLEVIGRWPGRQSVPHAFERLQELRDNELCGCEAGCRNYIDCCKPSDLAADRAAIAMDFLGNFARFQTRQPPERIWRFLRKRDDPPGFLEELR